VELALPKWRENRENFWNLNTPVNKNPIGHVYDKIRQGEKDGIVVRALSTTTLHLLAQELASYRGYMTLCKDVLDELVCMVMKATLFNNTKDVRETLKVYYNAGQTWWKYAQALGTGYYLVVPPLPLSL
jgi:hypothetical protein